MERLRDDEIESLVAGRVPAGREDLELLAAFAQRVGESLPEAPAAAVETAHLAAIVEAVRLSGCESPGRIQTSRRKTMLSTIFGTLAGKLAVATVAAAAATGGLAATGSLPAPAQDAVAAAVSHVGVHFPSSSDDQGNAGADDHGTTVSTSARTTDATGREKGQEISQTASTNAAQHRQDVAHRQDTAHIPATAPPSGATGPGSPVTPSGNPTGFGQDNHPSGNPTGFGQDNHPSGNPTGHGRP
jgi:hypothetical protein